LYVFHGTRGEALDHALARNFDLRSCIAIEDRRHEARDVEAAAERSGKRAQEAKLSSSRADDQHAEHLAFVDVSSAAHAKLVEQDARGALGERVRAELVERARHLLRRFDASAIEGRDERRGLCGAGGIDR
jgi:hypothetical protein